MCASERRRPSSTCCVAPWRRATSSTLTHYVRQVSVRSPWPSWCGAWNIRARGGVPDRSLGTPEGVGLHYGEGGGGDFKRDLGYLYRERRVMLNFDRVLTYQFGCFFGQSAPDEEIDQDQVRRLAEVVAAPVPGVTEPTVAFSSSQMGSALVVQGNGVVSQNQIAWQGAAGIWKLTLSGVRCDLFFDARGHADARGVEPLSLQNVNRRVSANMARAILSARFPVNRILLAVNAERNADGSDAVRLVARRFYRSELQREAEAGRLVEASARAAEREKWSLADRGEIAVNCIEQGAATWALEGRTPRTRLQWQFDANTAPELADDTMRFDEAEIEAFFTRAVNWIEERFDALG